MKKIPKVILILTAICAVFPLFSDAGIYVLDGRMEYFQTYPERKRLSDSVVSLWESASVLPAGKAFKLRAIKFGDAVLSPPDQPAKFLCPGESFSEQPLGAFCSGALVGEDLVMTAGHCIKNEAKCADTRLIFGFAVKSASGDVPAAIPAGDVYSCKRIVKWSLPGAPGQGSEISADYALIQLDRKVTGRKPLAISRRDARKGDKVFAIGHPLGLPLKITGGQAFITEAPLEKHFVTNLDTFGGNSGSPVFSASTNLIEGILVRGDSDFKEAAAGCITLATYNQRRGTMGEHVTKVTLLRDDIPMLSAPKKTGKTVNFPVAADLKDVSGIVERFGLKFD